ncbi:flagellar protein FlaG [Caulobacter sp. BK020]|uniref:flagellar protein FlaG n=1 Tax=Caulobacter sp. BK020 TaxID=2512117 RepID=UPI0010CE65C5|nr:flagellar protein FlaG [Caulobacter sp. BK020]TCS15011.1 flagellar protein FlaG [Caulobacter sp. BK020]
MENKVALTSIPPEPSTPVVGAVSTVPGHPAGGVFTSATRGAAPEKPAPVEKFVAADGPQPGDLRLVIEQDSKTGTYIYKTVDRRTGDILQQFPREEVLRFKQAEHYDPGEVFDGLT